MNDTKWEELRVAMYELGVLHPRFQTKDLSVSEPSMSDGEWFYHFRLLPYCTIEWVDLHVVSEEQREAVRARLCAIHLPGEETDYGFRVYGWMPSGTAVKYIE